MDRDRIVELISNNRLQEAIQEFEKASRGTYLHNQIVLLSSSFAEYMQLNRNATEDFRTLEVQRARIISNLLSLLDEVEREQAEKSNPPPAYNPEFDSAQEASKKDINYKWIWYAAGALTILIVVSFVLGKLNTVPGDATTSIMPVDSTAEVLDEAVNNPLSVSTAGVTGSPETGKENTDMADSDLEMDDTPADIADSNLETDEAVNGQNVKLVLFGNDSEVLGEYRQVDDHWVEEDYGTNSSFSFSELGRDDWSVYLYDSNRGVNIQLDLYLKTVNYTDANNQEIKGLYKIKGTRATVDSPDNSN